MVSPPVIYSMQTHSAEVLTRRRSYLKIAGYGLALFFAAAAGTFALAYFKAPPTQAPALSAAVAEALSAQGAYEGITLVAQSALVLDIDTGAIVYEHNADVQLPLASLTKVPLVLVASEVLPPQAIITIQHDSSYNSKASQLLAGQRWQMKDLVSYTLVASSNDGAQTLADASSEALRAKYSQAEGDATLWRMNDLVSSLRLNSIYFLNPTGLDVSETQSGAYGSARDVAKLFAYAAINRPELFLDTATSSIRIKSLDGDIARATNTDEALDVIPGLIMGKTGLTDLAGGNLAVVFTVNDKRYAAVVLGSTETGRFSDIQTLTKATQNIGH